MTKATQRFEKRAYGVKVTFDNGRTSITQEVDSQPVMEEALIKSRKLFALTMMLTGPGFEAFRSLHGDDQKRVMALFNDLSSEVSALVELHCEMESGVMRERLVVQEAS